MRMVTSYINPDLDGVACALVYAAYLGTADIQPLFAGDLSAEPAGVLERLNLSKSISWITECGADCTDVVLVDCHHPAQLPHISDFGAVSLVIDHHPDGDPGAFPKAAIQNEMVGAASTLITERLIASHGITVLSSSHAALLAAAIASNTLEFSAPSTTDRDHTAYMELATVAEPFISLSELRMAMREWRNSFLTLSTADALTKDCKLIDTPYGRVAVSQLEGDNASTIAVRRDIVEGLAELASPHEITASLLSLVDTAANTTTLITTDPRLRQALLRLEPDVIDHVTLKLPFIALRKTHVIPAITQSTPNMTE
jgi:inorganic pyrophosphatase/exopolyphosphatase